MGGFLESLAFPAVGMLAIMLATHLVLGCFLDGFAMMVLSMPVFFPVAQCLGIDPIWFGVLVVLTLEVGLISPPVGLKVFIVKSVARDVPLARIFRSVIPFWLATLATLATLVAFPRSRCSCPTRWSTERAAPGGVAEIALEATVTGRARFAEGSKPVGSRVECRPVAEPAELRRRPWPWQIWLR